MEALVFIALTVIGLLVYSEIKKHKEARDGLADLQQKGFSASIVCNFGDTKVVFDSEHKQIAFVNLETPNPTPSRGPAYFRFTSTEPYSNLKHLRIDRQQRDLESAGSQVPSLVFTFHEPNSRDGKLRLWMTVSCIGSSELEKLMKAWPAELEVRRLTVATAAW